MSEESKKSGEKSNNHLINEKSPYLLQHANNPVNWYPWSDEAFKKAKNENKPILLSIGYATCHWCHVMAHESFEDREIANIMNETFVSIKVDREERPDIDSIYMTVCQMMTGTGGWPLTIFMTPDKKPFFAGTYFPKESIHGNVGIKDLILNVGDLWVKDPQSVLESADKIANALKKVSTTSSGEELDESILNEAFKGLSRNYDETYGGFGNFPKFPMPQHLLFLLRYWRRTGNEKALNMVEKTLTSMRNGGIYDHVGFGFHRYSVDKEWVVPHFEKMLYDQATIAMAYIETFQATGKEKYRKTAEEIFNYVLGDIQSPKGGFHSARDADSEGVEGKFYLWSENEIFQIVDEEEAEFISYVFNISEEGNFCEESTGQKTGTNILYRQIQDKIIADDFEISTAEVKEKIENIREKLYSAREKRVHPQKDDKILTDWNGLMIASLSKAAQVLNGESYLNTAKNAADFILTNMCKNNRLLHRYRDNQAAITGNLDDYAFMIWGLLELYEACFDVKYLKSAISLNKTLMEHFWDVNEGGFYFTPDDGEEVLIRKKEILDSAVPSGNSVQILNLIRLARITENPEFERKSVEIEKAFSKTMKEYPMAYTQAMIAVDFKVGPSYDVVIAGDPNKDDTKTMVENIENRFIPNKVVILKDSTKEELSDINEIGESLKFKKPINGKATAYICTAGTCKAPTNDITEMLNLMDVK